MQIRTGTAAVTNGSNRVIASPGNDWSQAVAGTLFGVPGANTYYVVATQSAPGVSVSGNWEVTLTGNYSGGTDAASAYAISRDFTPRSGLPLMNYGDANAAQLFSRAMTALDTALATAAVGGSVPYEAALSYAAGQLALGSDGNVYRAIATTLNHNPTTDAGTYWELFAVRVNTTLAIPSRFATLSAAWAFLKNTAISSSVLLTIQFANGTYNMMTGAPANGLYNLNHGHGERIQLLGDIAGTVGNVTLSWTTNTYIYGGTYANDSMGAFYVNNGYKMPYLNGFKMTGAGNSKLHYGLQATNGSVIKCGPKMWITDFYAGVAVFFGSNAFIDTMRISNGGDGNIFAYCNASVSFQNGISEGANTYYGQSGACIEFASSLFAPGATFRLNNGSQVLATWGSSMMLDGCTFQSGGAFNSAPWLKCAGGNSFQRAGGTFTNCSSSSYQITCHGVLNDHQIRLGLETAFEGFFGTVCIVSDTTKPSLSLTSNGVGTMFTGYDSATGQYYTGIDNAAKTMDFRVGVSKALSDGTQVMNLEVLGVRIPGTLRVGTHANPLNSANFGQFQLTEPTNTATCFSITQAGIGTLHFGFASGAANAVFGADLGDWHFRDSPTATMAAGTLRAVLGRTTGQFALGGLKVGGGATPGTNGTAITGIRHGTAVLVAGTVTVADTTVTANTRIFAVRMTDGGTVGTTTGYSITRVNNTSFTITGKVSAGTTATADTSTMAYLLIEP